MSAFTYRKGRLHVEDVPVEGLAAQFGTPTYVYSTATLRDRWTALREALTGVDHRVCYSVKANSNLALLRWFAGMGAGFDVVSGGELARVKRAGGRVREAVFSGVGKTREELLAAHAAGLGLFNVESAEELWMLDAVGRELGRPAPFALRVNPDVDAKTHRYIATGLKSSKFGVPFDESRALYRAARRRKGLLAVGVDCHIGSQLLDLAPLHAALDKVAGLYEGLRREDRIPLTTLDVGGGLGIDYGNGQRADVDAYGALLRQLAARTGAHLVLEPGRYLTGNAGALLARVLYRKPTEGKTFVVVDAGMNDLLRPALYDAAHRVLPARVRGGDATAIELVGPVCESSDVLARALELPLPRQGDVVALMDVGAYGASMASTYNSRGRPCELLVSGGAVRVIRERDPAADLWRHEHP